MRESDSSDLNRRRRSVTFAERLDGAARPFARVTEQVQTLIDEAGGLPGERLLRRVGVACSADTLLLVRLVGGAFAHLAHETEVNFLRRDSHIKRESTSRILNLSTSQIKCTANQRKSLIRYSHS
jgi:hypothetical protein